MPYPICARNVFSVEADLNRVENQLAIDTSLQLLKRSVIHMSHILNRCQTVNEVKSVLYSRLVHLSELRSVYNALEQELPRPFLVSWYPLPDLPHAALIRTLQGHSGMVNSCAVSPTGDYIVSASDDQTLKLWDARTGAERFTLQGHSGPVRGCAVSPTGDYIVSASDDWTLKVWDARTGSCTATMYASFSLLQCTCLPDGEHLVAVGDGGIYFLRLVR